MTFFRRYWVTGKPHSGQGQLSVFVPHLGQVMVMSPFGYFKGNPFFVFYARSIRRLNSSSLSFCTPSSSAFLFLAEPELGVFVIR